MKVWPFETGFRPLTDDALDGVEVVVAEVYPSLFKIQAGPGEVKDLAQLTDVLSALKLTPGLSQVRRATVAEAESVALADWDGEDEERVPA